MRTRLSNIVRMHQRPILGVVSLLVFLVAWESTSPLINPLLFTWPSAITKALYNSLLSGELTGHLYISVLEFVMGFGVALAVGTVVGIGMGRWRIIESVADPFVTLLYSTPKVTFIPVLILWFGLGMKSKIALVFLISVIPILLNTYAGVKNVDQVIIDVARSFGVSGRRFFYKIILPSALPFMISGLRLGIGRGLVGMVVGEMFGATAGIGYMIAFAGSLYRIDKLFGYVFVLTVMGLALTEAVRQVEQRVAPWRVE